MPNDPRIRAFLDRAAAIVAASKGLTVECQQQLEVLATQLRLESGQWKQCLDELKNQTRTGQSYSRYEQAFLNAAEKNLVSISGRILSLGKEKLLLELASEKFQIGQVRAHQLLETVCEDLDIRRISRTDTEASFRELAVSLIGSARRAAPEIVSQLTDAGKGWGLTDIEVRTIVNHVIVAGAHRRMRRVSRAAKLLLLIAIMAGIIAWSANFYGRIGRYAQSGSDQRQDDSVTSVLPTPEWFPTERIHEQIGSLDDGKVLTDLCNRLPHESATERMDTYAQIAELSVDPFGPAPENVAGLLYILLAADPDHSQVTEWDKSCVIELETRIRSAPVSGDAIRRALRLAELAQQLDNRSKKGEPETATQTRLAAINTTKLGGNGPAGLILQWWAQLVYQEPVPVAKTVAVTGLLHQFSLQYLPDTLANQWRHRLLTRTVQASPESVSQLGDELRNSIRDSGPTEMESWIHLWKQLESAPQRDKIGRLVLQHASGNQPMELDGTVESTMNRLFINLIQKRYSAIFELQAVADQSLQLARRAQQNQSDRPYAIAITAQAVNDALLVIMRARSIQSEQPVVNQLVPSWRFGTVAGEPATTESASSRNPPVATPADFRTFDDAMTEFGSASLLPERAGFRILALENLQRIAPRMDDIPSSAATTLANRFLQEMSVEEWLAVEKSLPAFRFWPTLGLALSDRIANDPVNLDQAISITQLVADPGFRLDKAGDWRVDCSHAIAKNVVHILEQQLLPAETKNLEQWQRVRSAIGRIYFSRGQILGNTDSQSGGQMTPSVQAIRLARAGQGPQNSTHPDLHDGINIFGQKELEITVGAAVTAARRLGEDLEGLLPTGEAWNGFPAGDRPDELKPSNLGNQLLAIESELLEYVTLIRRYQVVRLTAELP